MFYPGDPNADKNEFGNSLSTFQSLPQVIDISHYDKNPWTSGLVPTLIGFITSKKDEGLNDDTGCVKSVYTDIRRHRSWLLKHMGKPSHVYIF